ncbi:MAG TPA: ATP-binding cassette domain-containing protein [Gemmatimonadaceae bacterium]|nr:ATP-binding cassette domain-containing protein [Gemmatimonadaceae bacterium]
MSELQLRNISKRFGSVAALDHAQLNVDHGTVHALLGENGAGKTTLMRIAYGMIRPDSGTIAIDGVEQKFGSPADALAAGIGMVQQHYALVDRMTVAENVALVGTAARDWRYSADQAARTVRQLGEEVGLEIDPTARVSDLSIAGQQRVEIFKALARSARILILDEPTAVLAPAEAAQLLAWLRRVADAGRTVVLITHKLRDALGVADNVTVLRQGRTVATMPARSATEESLAVAMLGSAPSAPIVTAKPTRSAPGVPVIRVDGVDIVDARGVLRVHDATFVVHAGEIVGIAAVEGEGQVPLLQAIAGRRRVAAGRLEAPIDIGFVPEDRLRDALIEDFPLYENVYLRGAGRARGRVHWAAQRQATATLLERFDIRAAGPNVSARTLSGGNQQRLVLGRELGGELGGAAGAAGTAASSIIALNPTRGLDIQATAAIHDRLLAARDAGAAIVLYSSDLDEVLELADRVLVLAHRTVQEIPPPFDRDLVGRAMLGLR